MQWEWWLILALAVAGLWVALSNRAAIGALRQRLEELQVSSGHDLVAADVEPVRGSGGVAVVWNPAKVSSAAELKEAIGQASRDAGYGEPAWFETTPEDPGVEQTRAALALNPSVVVAVGGDGTVRVVAGELAGTDVPLGIIPAGTGNLLARNLNVPIVSTLRDAASVAITGRGRRIDLGRISAGPATATAREAIAAIDPEAAPFEGSEPFVVIAGMGFDADVMNDADGGLKKTMGWAAYVVSGVKFLRRSRFSATIATAGDDGEVVDTISARSILFGNCARLPAGFVLAPDARIDDGWLDVMVVDTKGGLIGWGDLLRRVTLQSVGVRKQVLPAAGEISMRRMRSVQVHLSEPELIEVDGDPLGYATDVTVNLEASSLIVHVL